MPNQVGLNLDRHSQGQGALVPFAQSPQLLISVVTEEPGGDVACFIESLAEQTYPLNKIRIRIALLGTHDNTVSRLLRLKEKMGYRFAGMDVEQLPGESVGKGHNKNTQDMTETYLIVASPGVRFEDHALTTVVQYAMVTQTHAAVWELQQAAVDVAVPSVENQTELLKRAASCALIRQTAFFQIGGFNDEEVGEGAYLELWYRFRDSGYRLLNCPNALYRLPSEPPARVKSRVRPYQVVLSDIFMRMRYGTLGRRLAVPYHLLQLCRLRTRQRHGQIAPAEMALRIAKNATRYLAGRRRSSRIYPMGGWGQDFLTAGDFMYGSGGIDRGWPLVSIVVRTEKGRQGLLSECLRSLANQTYLKLEVIVVEAGSSGFARDILDAGLFGSLRRIKYIQCDHKRPSRTGNAGLEAASGDYVAVIDDDNLLFSDHVERLVRLLEERRDLTAAYTACFEVETEILSSDPLVYTEGRRRALARRPYSKRYLARNDFIPVTSMIFRRSVYERRGGFDPTLAAAEAWDLWLRLCKQGPFGYVPHVTAICRSPAGDVARHRREEILRANRRAIREKHLQLELAD